MPLSAIVTTTFILLIVAALCHPASERSRLPYAVVLVMAGLILSFCAKSIQPVLEFGLLAQVADMLAAPPVSSQLFLYVLLPILLFQGAVRIDIRHLARDSVAVFALAIVAVLVSIGLIGGAVHLVSGLDLSACLLLAAIVATTDPSAVIAIFRELGAPARLTRLVEGESLLNDAAAIAAFGVLLGAVLSGTQPSMSALASQLALGLVFGAVLGLLAGTVLMHLIEALSRLRAAQMTLVLATPYLVFLAGDASPLVSGVVAVVAAGAVVGFIGRSRLERSGFAFLRDLLDQTADWSTGLIFLLAALMVPQLLSATQWSDMAVLGAVIAAALTARALILMGLAPLLSFAGLMRPISVRMNTALLWGGLRGAMTLALALSVSETAGIAPDAQRMITVAATSYTLFTLFAQGTTLRLIVRGLGLTQLTPVERAFRSQALGDAVERTRERVRQFARRAGLQDGPIEAVLAPYEARLTDAADQASFENISDTEKIRLGLAALVNQERNLLLEQRWSSGLPARMVDQYLFQIDALRDSARLHGRSAYLTTARAPYRQTLTIRLASALHNRLRLQRPLASMLGRRFHALLVTRIMVSQLEWYCQGRLTPIFGARISDILGEILLRRREEIERQLDAIRLQYPDFTRALENSLIERYAHHEEIAQVRALENAGVIAPDIASSLIEEAEGIHRALKRPGRVDITPPKPDLLKSLRAFEKFAPEDLVGISRRLRSAVFPAGTTIYRPSDRVDHIYFIANGAVEVVRDGEDPVRLGRGQAFGQMRVLNPSMKRAQVKSLSTTHCFRMSIQDFRELTRNAPSWKAALDTPRLSSRRGPEKQKQTKETSSGNYPAS